MQWINRWDAQQQLYMPDREERFTALIDAVQAGTGRDDPLVLALRAAGFTEIGTLWQYGDNRILCAVLGGL